MTHSEAHIFARELRNRITEYGRKCERIEVVKICDHFRVEIRPAKGESIISHHEVIFNAVRWFNMCCYINAEKDVPCVIIF